MKKLFMVACAIAMSMFMGCTSVSPGNGGIKVVVSGSDRGVSQEVLPTGITWVGLNTQVFEFPLYTINYTFTKDSSEGSPDNEEFSLQSIEGLICGIDLGVSARFEKSKLPNMFEKYRKGVEEIRAVVIRNAIRDGLNRYASKMTAEEIYATRKTELLDSTLVYVKKVLEPNGIIIEELSFIGGVRPPQTIVTALNAKVEATQKAMQRENELRTAEAEAKKQIAEAEGIARSNELKTKSATPEAIRLMELENQKLWIEKWNGVVPATVMGSGQNVFYGLK